MSIRKRYTIIIVVFSLYVSSYFETANFVKIVYLPQYPSAHLQGRDLERN